MSIVRATVRRLPAMMWDWVLALVLLAVGQSEVWLRWSDGGVGRSLAGARPAEAAVVAAMTLPLAWRRIRPLAALSAVGGALIFQALVLSTGAPFLVGLLPLLLLIFAVARYAPATVAVVGLAVAAIVVVALTIRIPALQTSGELAFSAVVTPASWGLGFYAGRRQAHADALASRTLLLQAEREQQARAAVAERARIARELHDVVAHSVSVMGVQAGAARMLLAADPARAEHALRSIERISREAVDELRRLLGVLRAEGEELALAPQPGLADVDRLVEQVRAAGVTTELMVDGERNGISPGVDLAAFRIVQEALTNTLKHANARQVRVHLRYGPQKIEIQVDDDGNGAGAGSGSGHGLVGMRERANLYGGTLSAGPRLDGGFRVHARLPRAVQPT